MNERAKINQTSWRQTNSRKKAVVVDVAIPTDNSIKRKKLKKLAKYQGVGKGSRKHVASEGHGGAGCNWSPWGCDPQTGRVVPADSKNTRGKLKKSVQESS